MKYRKFDGKEISEIGMGCYALSGAYGSVENKAYKKVLKHAVDLGVNFFDTADTYGPKAEEILGDVLNPVREDVFIQTKVGIKEGVKPNLSYDYVMSACDESLERLDTSYIDYYLIHFADPETPTEETVAALEDLKGEGKIDGYGVGHISMENIRQYLKEGNPSVALMELNAIARGAKKEMLPFCREHELGAFAFSVTGRGILTGKYQQKPKFEPGDIRQLDAAFQHVRFESALRVVDKIKELGKKYDRSPVQVAIQWVLAQDGVISALTGPSKKEHLEENIGGSGWGIYEEDMEELENVLQREEEYLKKEEPKVIERILKNPLNDDIQEAYSDLVYVMEASISNSIVSENKIMPTFQKLWSMRSSEGEVNKEKLKDIQTTLRNIITG